MRTSCSPLKCHAGEPPLGTFRPGQPGARDSRIVTETEPPGMFQATGTPVATPSSPRRWCVHGRLRVLGQVALTECALTTCLCVRSGLSSQTLEAMGTRVSGWDLRP